MNRSSFVSKLLTPVITLLVLAYFGYQIYGYVSDPFSTTLAYTYQVEDTVDISGYVVRQEQVLTGDAGGLMRLRKNEGERVGTGGAVATVYADQASLDRQNEIETLNNRIEQLEYAQESMLGAEVTLKLDSQIARSLLDYRTVVAAGRLDAAESRGQELRSLVLKRDYTYSGTEDLSGQLQELKNQLKTLRSQAANSVKTIRSPRSGLFSAVVDGYESVLTPDSLSALTPSALNKLSPAELPANTGKLILGDNWYYVGVVSAQEAQTLSDPPEPSGNRREPVPPVYQERGPGPVGHAFVRERGGKRPLCGDFPGEYIFAGTDAPAPPERRDHSGYHRWTAGPSGCAACGHPDRYGKGPGNRGGCQQGGQCHRCLLRLRRKGPVQVGRGAAHR